MFVHATDGAKHGMNKILLRTVDTDVVVIGISMAQKIGCDRLLFAFGTGTSPTFRYLAQQLRIKHLATLHVVAFLRSVP